jgi:hypothetical protein
VAGGTGFLWEINGSDGTLRITADAPFPGIFPVTVAGVRRICLPCLWSRRVTREGSSRSIPARIRLGLSRLSFLVVGGRVCKRFARVPSPGERNSSGGHGVRADAHRAR